MLKAASNGPLPGAYIIWLYLLFLWLLIILSHWDLVSGVPLEMVMEANMGRCTFSAVQCHKYKAKKSQKMVLDILLLHTSKKFCNSYVVARIEQKFQSGVKSDANTLYQFLMQLLPQVP